MQYCRPRTLEDALSCLSETGWRVLAGGTDVFPASPPSGPDGPILDITAIDSLRGIVRDGGFWSIGAATAWRDVIDAELPSAFDGLQQAAREVGSPQIQSTATVAGNICNASPAADGVPPLLTLDAVVEIASLAGARRMPLQDFILGNRQTTLGDGELVTRVLVPETSARGVSSFLKLGARRYLVISISMVAVRLAIDDGGRIADAAVSVGACSEVAQRLPVLEGRLGGLAVSDLQAVRVTSDDLRPLQPIDDIRATAAYRLDAASEIIHRTVAQAAEGLR